MGIRDQLRRRSKFKVKQGDGLPPERIKELEAQAQELIMNGRPIGQFLEYIRQQLLKNGRHAPLVIADEKLGTMSVPADFEGLMALLASFDSLLMPEELQAIRDSAEMMVPMGISKQAMERARRAQEEADSDHIREDHPEQWTAMQGWRV